MHRLSLGSWLLVVFSLITFLHFYLWLPERFDLAYILNHLPGKFDRTIVMKWIRKSPFLKRFRREDLTRNRRVIAGCGIPVAIGVAIYTGVLLGALNARPF